MMSWFRKIQRIDLRGLIVVFGTVAALTVLILLATWLRLRYEETVQEATATAETLAKSAEIHTTRTMLNIDYMVVGLIEAVNNSFLTDPQALENTLSLLEQTSEQNLLVTDLFLVQLSGQRVIGSGGSAGSPVWYNDAPFFKAQQNSDTVSMMVGPPYRSTVTGRWSVIMSRKIIGEGFNGLIAAEVPTDVFSEFFHAINNNDEFQIFLYRSDSTVLATEPYFEQVIGSRLDEQLLFSDGLFAEGSGRYSTISPVTGNESLVAFRAVPVRPLLVTAGIDEPNAFDEWRANLRMAIGLMTAIGLMILLFTWALIRLMAGQRRAEAALTEAEKNYRSIFDNAPIGIFRSSLDGRLLRANPALTLLMGYRSEKELLQLNTMTGSEFYVDPNRRAEFRRALERDGVLTNFQSEVVCGDIGKNRRIWISENAHLVRDERGRPAFFEGTIEDITERVAADEQLNRFRVLVEASQEAIAVARLDGMLIYANRAHQQLFGHPSLDRKPRHWYDSLQSTGVEQFENEILPELESSHGWEGVLEAVDSSGSRFPLWARTDTINDENGNPQLVFALMHNYSSEIEMRNELRDARDRAQEANKAKSEFLATMSHELRTPLNAILGFSDIIRSLDMSTKVNPQKLPEYANDIHTSGTQLLEMINDILDISKIEAETLQIAPGIVEIRKVVGEAINLLRGKADEKSIELTVSLPRDLPAMQADERAMRQIVINLLSNAVKFTPTGGRIKIEAKTDSDGLVLRVSDTGIGIPEREIPRIMRPFEQVDNRYMNAKGGTGLGLPIVKALTELHGGQLNIESKVGLGTTITVYLPGIAKVVPADDGLADDDDEDDDADEDHGYSRESDDANVAEVEPFVAKASP